MLVQIPDCEPNFLTFITRSSYLTYKSNHLDNKKKSLFLLQTRDDHDEFDWLPGSLGYAKVHEESVEEPEDVPAASVGVRGVLGPVCRTPDLVGFTDHFFSSNY